MYYSNRKLNQNGPPFWLINASTIFAKRFLISKANYIVKYSIIGVAHKGVFVPPSINEYGWLIGNRVLTFFKLVFSVECIPRNWLV